MKKKCFREGKDCWKKGEASLYYGFKSSKTGRAISDKKYSKREGGKK